MTLVARGPAAKTAAGLPDARARAVGEVARPALVPCQHDPKTSIRETRTSNESSLEVGSPSDGYTRLAHPVDKMVSDSGRCWTSDSHCRLSIKAAAWTR